MPPVPSTKKISRRTFLQLFSACAALGTAACGTGEFDKILFNSHAPGLGALAKRNGRVYGAAVQSAGLADVSYAAALKRECAMLVPESELKWATVQPQRGVFDFSGYQRIAVFAKNAGMEMRGHTLVWHGDNPAWLEPALKNKRAAKRLLETHIHRVMKETAGTIKNWDVVNEAVHPLSHRADGLRPTCWLKALGADYIPLAYHTAHEAGPECTLVYNDYGVEYSDGNGYVRRKSLLRLLEKMKKDGVPLHALGLQSHLRGHRPLGGKEFTKFLAEVRALGLAVYVTELDLDLSGVPGTSADKIKAGENYLRIYLELVQQGGPIPMLLTWGLSDGHSWLRDYIPDTNGALPLDKNLNRDFFWETLRKGWAQA